MNPVKVIPLIASSFLFMGTLVANDINLATQATVTASSHRGGNKAVNINDGVISDDSRWLAAFNVDDAWVELEFAEPIQMGTLDLYTGWKNAYVLNDFDVSIEVAGKWMTPTEGKIRGNQEPSLRIEFADTVKQVSKIRIFMEEPVHGNIRELAIYANVGVAKQSGLRDEDGVPVIARDIHQIGLNQVGYLPTQPKRFTAPLSADGSQFIIRAQDGNTTLFQGSIQNHIGDFSAFQPKSSNTHYVIDVSGGDLKTNRSHPFLISKDLYEAQYWQPAVDFLIDSRSVIGTHASAYGGCPWRDGTYYDAIIPSLAMFYAANPELIDSMPKQIDWAAERDRVMDPDFQLASDDKSDRAVLFAAKQYFRLEPPRADAPDVVKLIHWGAGYYLMNPATHDPSGDPLGRQIHPQTVEQVSYVLWAWPMLKQWLPQSFYDRCYDFCFNTWQDKQDVDSLEISPLWDPKTYITAEEMGAGNKQEGLHRHPYKGRHAPGHSIVPNLIMHEVAKKHDRADAQIYLDAAVEQAQWIIDTLDWKDPRTSKGHRMSEHRTIPNLVWLLQKYPEAAPKGLKEKITEWARVAVSRSDNLWDFRRYDDEMWTLPGMNELGNSLSIPAIGMAASWVIDDADLKERLLEVTYASIDHVFGRNPRLASSVAHPEMGFPEIDQEWPRHFPKDRCARLELCRGSISSLPGSEMYPFNPESVFRHEEGWVNYGAAWCISLSYLQWNLSAQTTPALSE